MYHKRRRLKDFDYAGNGSYFITFCTIQQECVLWTRDVFADNLSVQLSDIGVFVQRCIEQVSSSMPSVTVDKYVIMPNHIHMIISLSDSKASISGIVHFIKSQTTKHIGYSVFQHSFHDRIIRNMDEYEKIWNYIEDNPRKWNEDKYYWAPCVADS